ncbi:flagellar C1a complex subunit C1a-32-domain-containing protein [Chytriomyces sp. MP71]|nr:flagellar C1a complex subunit C1a-32-domain-containing protein [Chytriomyces sp. MP71]
MAESLTWKDLSMKQVYEFYDQQTPEDGIKFLQDSIDETLTTQATSSDKRAILLDMYYYILAFAKENNYTPEKTSAFFSIMKTTHEKVSSSPFVKFDADFEFFKTLLLKHCISRSPFSEQIFSFNEMKQITEYATNTYFRHYLMYKFAFTKQIKLDFKITNAYRTPTASIEKLTMDDQFADTTADAAEPGTTNVPDVTSSQQTELAASALAPLVRAPSITVETATLHTSNAAPISMMPSVEPVAASVADVPKEEKTLEQSKHDIASEELKNLVLNTLGPKLEELKAALLGKLSTQEAELSARIKKIEADEEKILAAQNDKAKKDTKPKGKK